MVLLDQVGSVAVECDLDGNERIVAECSHGLGVARDA